MQTLNLHSVLSCQADMVNKNSKIEWKGKWQFFALPYSADNNWSLRRQTFSTKKKPTLVPNQGRKTIYLNNIEHRLLQRLILRFFFQTITTTHSIRYNTGRTLAISWLSSYVWEVTPWWDYTTSMEPEVWIFL